MKNGSLLITEKRIKQLEKLGYTHEHDTEHTYVQLVNAARAYMYRESNHWPFYIESFKLGTPVENLINAGACLSAAIDILQRYKVGAIYHVKTTGQEGDFKVTKIQYLKSGTTLIHFVGLNGDLRPEPQKFMLGSIFDLNSNPL